jgi:hypothetical protein
MLSLSSIHKPHSLVLSKLSYIRIWFLWLLVMLSPTVLSHHTSLSIFMMLSLTCVESVGLPSVMM